MRQVRTGTSDRFAPCRSTRKIEWMPAVHNLGTPEINKHLVCLFMTTDSFVFQTSSLGEIYLLVQILDIFIFIQFFGK